MSAAGTFGPDRLSDHRDKADFLVALFKFRLCPRADIGQTLAPTHALTKKLYSVMLLTQFLS